MTDLNGELKHGWLPSYLYRTAYGERVMEFGQNKQETKLKDHPHHENGKTRVKRTADADEDENDNENVDAEDGEDNEEQEEEEVADVVVDEYEEEQGSDTDMGLLNNDTQQFRLPQLMATRSAADLYSTSDAEANYTNTPNVNSILPIARLRKARKAVKIDRPTRKEIGVPPVPTCWVKTSTQQGLDTGKNGRLEYIQKTGQNACAVRTDCCVPSLCGVYYYEVKVVSMANDALMSIGFCDEHAAMNKLPGLETNSWGYHSDDGRIIANQGTAKNYGPGYGANDTVGCGINFYKSCIFYTKNGVALGPAFGEVQSERLCPAIGMRPGQIVEANFGTRQFKFDIDKYIRDEKAKVEREIEMGDNVAKAIAECEKGGQDPHDFIQKLVASYFAHVGFLETSKAFDAECRESNSNNSDAMDLDEDLKEEGSNDAQQQHQQHAEVEVYNRQKIRELIVKGDIDTALNRLEVYYPKVLEKNDVVLFKLKCRKFVELIRQSADSVDTETKQQVTQLVLKYGQELQHEYKDDPRPQVKDNLDEVFGLLAYENPRNHAEVAELFDDNILVCLADELNSEILVSLGKPSVPSLQKLAQHTTQLVWEMSDVGYSAANFINVRKDYME